MNDSTLQPHKVYIKDTLGKENEGEHAKKSKKLFSNETNQNQARRSTDNYDESLLNFSCVLPPAKAEELSLNMF